MSSLDTIGNTINIGAFWFIQASFVQIDPLSDGSLHSTSDTFAYLNLILTALISMMILCWFVFLTWHDLDIARLSPMNVRVTIAIRGKGLSTS